MKSAKKEKYNSLIRKRVCSSPYKKLLCEGDEYIVTGPSCYNDILIEAAVLNHQEEHRILPFIFGKINIYFLRLKDFPSEPFYTMEVKRDEFGQYYLCRCYGYGKAVQKSKSCIKFIKKWCSTKAVKIACAL